MSRPLKARLQAGEILCGTILSIAASEVADLLAGAGFDWLFVDAEHGALEPRDVLLTLQVVAGRTPCLVRIPALDEAWVKRVLDAGADGIIVPQVSTAEQAERAVRFAHYPPRGSRGLGTARANRYGLGLAGHFERARETVTVVVQAETAEAVRNIEEIVRVPDLDAVFVGPFDLSASLGHPGEVDHPEVRSAIGRVAEACRLAQLRTGIFALGAVGLRSRPGEGFTLLAAGVDGVLLGGAAEALLDDLRRQVAFPAGRAPGT
jgi:2-dehydro-3-deoxyglucarate aldolase/4-hydroxy-2-oxoheptanedioate aldolase